MESMQNQLPKSQVTNVSVATQEPVEEAGDIKPMKYERQMANKCVLEGADCSYSQLQWECFNQAGSTSCIPIDFDSLFVTHKTSVVEADILAELAGQE